VPYSGAMIANAAADFRAQANPGADNAALLQRYPGAVTVGSPGAEITEMDALIAYLQILGTEVKFRDVTPEELRQ
jgi:cytochrome c oxidase cbb3-type subunit II